MRPMHHKTTAIAIAGSLLLTACAGRDGDDTAAPAPPEAETSAPAPAMDATTAPAEDEMDDGGAVALMSAGELRATLTSLLQEHVYLSGITVETLADADGDLQAAPVEAAVTAVDENSVAIAGLIGAVAPDEEAGFLDLWREHLGFFLDYARSSIVGDDTGQQEARANLDGYRTASGAFFETLTGGALPADAVADNFAIHVDTLTAAFDAFAAGDDGAFDRLQAAASHMAVSAQALATGFATALPDAFPGDVADAEAETLATLTYVLGEHVYLSGLTFEQLAEADGDLEDPTVRAATAELDENSVTIAGVVGSLAPDEEAGFLALWREHLGFFTDYALGAIAEDDEAQAEALANLDGYRTASGAFFETLTGGALTADAVAENFGGHVDTLNAAIDLAADGDVRSFTRLRAAARHMPGTAAALTGAIHAEEG